MKNHCFGKRNIAAVRSLCIVLDSDCMWLIKNQQTHLQFLSSEIDLLHYYLLAELYKKDDVLYCLSSAEESGWQIAIADPYNKGLKDPGFMLALSENQINSLMSVSLSDQQGSIYFFRFFSRNKQSKLTNDIFNNLFAIKHFFNTQINHINNIDFAKSTKFSLKPLAISD
jgi:hypothetical protein